MDRDWQQQDAPAPVRPSGPEANAAADMPVAPGGLVAVVLLCRPHQWIKNTFVLAPLFFSPEVLTLDIALAAVGASLCFRLVASAVYVLNDLMDREADRRHPAKLNRPLAAGTVSVGTARHLIAGSGLGGFAAAAVLSPPCAAVLGAYALPDMLYTLRLKRVAILDVAIVALGFVLRLEAGALVIGVGATGWIVVCGGLLALFLALAKRRDDLVKTLDARAFFAIIESRKSAITLRSHTNFVHGCFR